MVSALLFVAAIALPPKLDHYVTDRAGVLKNAAVLEDKVSRYESQTSIKVFVYVDSSLPPNRTIDEMGAEAKRLWIAGEASHRVIVMIFASNHAARIEVDDALRGSFSDAEAQKITSDVIEPELLKGNYEEAIDRGVDAICKVLGDQWRGPKPASAAKKTEDDWIRKLFMVLLFVAFFAQVYVGAFFGLQLTASNARALRRSRLVWFAMLPATFTIAVVVAAIIVTPGRGVFYAIAALTTLGGTTLLALLGGALSGAIARPGNQNP